MKFKKWIFIFLVIFIMLPILFFVWSKSPNNDSKILLLLVSDSVALDDPVIVSWTNTAKEVGALLKVMHDSEYLKIDWEKHKRFSGIILPDSGHKVITPSLLGQLTKYLNVGGNLMITYDAAIHDVRENYFIDGPPFSDFFGLKYGLYGELKEKSIITEPIGHYSNGLVKLGIPHGKFISNDSMTNGIFYSPKKLIEDDLFSLLSTYQYGLIYYPHFFTNGDYKGKILLTSQSKQIIAGLSKFNSGKILFVNLPLGYLCVRTDCLLQQVFLRYFTQEVCRLPLLSTIPDGVGGLIMNIHVDSNADEKPFLPMKNIGFFDQGPYSIDFTAGPDDYRPGDGLGLNVENNKNIQKWIDFFISQNHSIGNHGGWLHNFFGINVNENNSEEFEKYLLLNSKSMENATGKKISEYAAPAGNQPEWVTKWLEDHMFTAYYSPGNTGSSPTRAFTNGQLKYKIWSFPILSLYHAASFEEFEDSKFPEEGVEDWLTLVTNFVVTQHTTRLFYFHPHSIYIYLNATKSWLEQTKKMLLSGKFRWYTMNGIADFLNQREKVRWSIIFKNKQMIVSAEHDDSLKNQAWLILKNTCNLPTILSGLGTIKDDDNYWIVSVNSGKRFIFSCLINNNIS